MVLEERYDLFKEVNSIWPLHYSHQIVYEIFSYIFILLEEGIPTSLYAYSARYQFNFLLVNEVYFISLSIWGSLPISSTLMPISLMFWRVF